MGDLQPCVLHGPQIQVEVTSHSTPDGTHWRDLGSGPSPSHVWDSSGSLYQLCPVHLDPAALLPLVTLGSQLIPLCPGMGQAPHDIPKGPDLIPHHNQHTNYLFAPMIKQCPITLQELCNTVHYGKEFEQLIEQSIIIKNN